ncbi:MAG: substrate-binding domain-containing protein [Lachnospiraceae bacterium]|nr:substrate-binding domain-containing protein [Lachnospiraceae bacterium]
MTKKKLIIIIVIVLVLAAFLIPIPNRYKDGGTVEYKALLYSYTKYHALSINKNENGEYEEGFDVGSELKILWFTVYKDTHFEKDSDSNTLIDNSGKEITNVPTNESTPTTKPIPTPVQITKDLPILQSGKTLSFDTLPVVDGAKALEPFYDAVFAELLGISVDDAKSLIWCNNTPDAYKNLTYGKADMIFCALPSKDQIEEAEENGVEFEYHNILSGGFVFFVNKDNPVDSVSQEELKGIVSGKITNWKELGGEDEPIVLFQRNEGSGSQTGLYRYVLPKEKVMAPSIEQTVSDMEGVVDRVSDYDNGRGAISYSYYYYVANMYTSDQIKLLGIDYVIPSDETISKGEYPFLNCSQVITRKDLPKDSIVWDIIAYIQGENGARIARENGYVPYLAIDGDSGTVSLNSDEALEKGDELRARLLAAGEYSTVGTGKEFNEKIIKDQEYGIERRHPDILEYVDKADNVSILHVKGLKDKQVEKKINDRIDEFVEIILDPAYYPERSGIIPFLNEHGHGEREIDYSVYYSKNHILSLDIFVTFRWVEPVVLKWFTDLPDINDDGRITDDDIYQYLYDHGKLDTIRGVDAYTGQGLHSSSYEEKTYFNNVWDFRECITQNFNLETGEEIMLSDLFTEGSDYLDLVNNAYLNQVVKYYHTFDDYYLDENGREKEGWSYDPELEYDGGLLFTGMDPKTNFLIYENEYIELYDNEGNSFFMELDLPVYNMVEFSDIFEDIEDKNVICLDEKRYYTWYSTRYDSELYEPVGTFYMDTNGVNDINVEVVNLQKEYETEILSLLPKNHLTDLAKTALTRSRIKFFEGDYCHMYPYEIYVLPNDYISVKWCIEIWREEEE